LFFIVRTDLVQVQWNSQSILLAIYLGVITMGLANALQILGLRGIAPGVAATMMLVDPVLAALLGVLVLNETITLSGAIGLGLVVIGLLMQGLSPDQPTDKRHKSGRHRAK